MAPCSQKSKMFLRCFKSGLGEEFFPFCKIRKQGLQHHKNIKITGRLTVQQTCSRPTLDKTFIKFA